MATAFPQIPYGWADFEAMRRERCLYVDKTRFVRELENERYAFLIRPRRFGKSSWVSACSPTFAAPPCSVTSRSTSSPWPTPPTFIPSCSSTRPTWRATIKMRVRQANWRRGKGESPWKEG